MVMLTNTLRMTGFRHPTFLKAYPEYYNVMRCAKYMLDNQSYHFQT